MWQALGNKNGISAAAWPQFDAKYLVEDTMELPVQINGKLRGRLKVPNNITEAALKDAANADEILKPFLEGKTLKKFIYVRNKILNIVV